MTLERKTAMNAPYRSAAPRAFEPRPLEPEDEMRLLLDAAEQPRGVRAWVLMACTLFGLVSLVWSFVGGFPWALSLYFLMPASTACAVWLRHRRRLERLRREGYDVGEGPRLRVDAEPRVRIDVEPDERGVEEELSGVPPRQTAADPKT